MLDSSSDRIRKEGKLGCLDPCLKLYSAVRTFDLDSPARPFQTANTKPSPVMLLM